MSSILKETENQVLPAAAPSAPAAKNSAEEQPRTQPVALEIPVTVNGARTVEGSDKREPFSETTKTVLVFGHGAVVRISSSLAPGQLIFLTNEKTKKEVVCQVVKSKNQGSANGYVELQFTESAPGYWGMRFPGSNSVPSAIPTPTPRPVAPVSAKPVPSAPAVAPSVTVAPATVAPTMVAASAPAALQSASVSALPTVSAAIKTSSAPILVEKSSVAKTESSVTKSEEVPEAVAPVNVLKIAIAENPSLDDLARELTKELLKGSPKELQKESPKAESSQSELPKIESPKASSEEVAAEVLNEAVKEIPSNVAVPETKAPAVTSDEPTSQELKQKTAQLQAQLSSLLFENASKKYSDSSAVVDASPSQTAAPSVSEKKSESTQSEPTPVQPLNNRPSSLFQKPLAQSIAVEEVKIPSWLAPLARETDFNSSESISTESIKTEATPDLASANDEAATPASSEDTPREHQPTMFGGQLITDASATAETSGSSKKGLWIGIAAATLLLAGGVWYANQPDNLIAGVFASKSVAASKSAAVPAKDSSTTPFRNDVSKPLETSRISPTTANNAAANSNAAIPIPNTNSTNSTASVSFPASKNPVATPSAEPSKVSVPVQPKKLIFGGAHLAAPKVKRAGGSIDDGDAEPAIENSSSVTGAASLNTLVANHGGPAMPLAVGGEVKQAKLVKSVPPIYPPTAKTQHMSGDVKLDALIDANGKVTSTKVISGPVLLHQAAMDAVKQWQYDPAQLNGKATSMHLTITVQFRLQ